MPQGARSSFVVVLFVVSIVSMTLSGDGCSAHAAPLTNDDQDNSASSSLPPFPCLLQHGCVCNHSQIVKNIYDQQYYSACSSCEKGWTGPLCDTIDAPCMNGGVTHNISNTSAPCICPPAWTGHACEDIQCPNSVGGHGVMHVAAPNPLTQRCDACMDGWGGITCGTCAADAACAPYSGAPSACDTSLLARGASKHLECTVTSKQFVRLLGHDVEGKVLMDCNSEAPDTPFASRTTGSCSVAFFRVEANQSYMDPFFFCTAQNCSLQVKTELSSSGSGTDSNSAASAADDTALNQPSSAFQVARTIGQTVLLGSCIFLAVVGQVAPMWPKKRISTAFLLSAGFLVVSLTTYVFLMVVIINSKDAYQRSVVTYHCDFAHCVCGPDPPAQYTPICSTSVFGEHILPIIAHGMDLTCHTDDNSCVFSPRDVPTNVNLACSASECVNTGVFPDEPTISGLASSSAQQHQDRNMLVVCVGIGLVLVGVTLLHIHVSFQKTWASSSAFERLFLGRTVRREPSLVDAELGTVDEEWDERDDAALVDEASRDTASSVDNDELAEGVASPDVARPGGGAPASYTRIAGHDSDEDDGDDGASPPSSDAQENEALVGGDNGSNARRRIRSSSDALPLSLQTMRPHDIRRTVAAPITLEVRRLSYVLKLPRCDMHLARRLWASSAPERPPLAQVDHHHVVSDDDDDTAVRHILNDVTFTVQSGEVLALMGPSGAGKTTLLDVLAMRLKCGSVSGAICVNGIPIHGDERKQQFRAMVGYVSQEDTLLPSLTVKETVWYAARLKLPTTFSDATIKSIVTSLLQSLRLERCADTLVGDGGGIRGISGGERRRVSIAVELVANPRILFLDEPTSGLDAVSAKVVMETVSQIARQSPMRRYAQHYFAFDPIVVFSIHQPSIEIFDLFDKVLLLSQGVAVYYGAAEDAVSFLAERLLRSGGGGGTAEQRQPNPLASPRDEGGTTTRSNAPLHHPKHQNPADVLMKLEDQLTEAIRDNLRAERAVTGLGTKDGHDCPDPNGRAEVGKRVLYLSVASRAYYPNVWQQIYLLSSRSFCALLGSFHLIVCHALVTFLVGTLMCVLYNKEALDLPGALNRAGSVTFLLLVVAFVSLSGLDALLSERKLLIVERENGYYGTLPYLCTKVVVDILPLRVLSVALLGAVIYFPMGLRTDDGLHFLWFLAILCMFSVCMTLLTFAVGIVMGTFGASALTSAVVILWNFVFGGLLVQADTIPYMLAPFRRISPFFLAFEALLVNELNGQMCTFAPTDATGKPSTTAIPLFCVQYLENLGLHPSRFAGDVVLLGVVTCALFGLVWLLLCGVRVTR